MKAAIFSVVRILKWLLYHNKNDHQTRSALLAAVIGRPYAGPVTATPACICLFSCPFSTFLILSLAATARMSGPACGGTLA